MCPAIENEKEVNSVRVWDILSEHGVHSLEGSDEFGPKFRSHDPSIDVLPRSSEKIRKKKRGRKELLELGVGHIECVGPVGHYFLCSLPYNSQ